MISKDHFNEIANKYGEFASWAVWKDEDIKPKSNIGNMEIFDIDKNPDLLETLRPNVLMVGLNCSRTVGGGPFMNFHDSNPRGQDFKIRFAFRGTEFYGAYMTDLIKGFEEKNSGNVQAHLKENKDFELSHIRVFEQEILDLKCENLFIMAFGNMTFEILDKHFRGKYNIKKVMHYSQRISKENYRKEVWNTLDIKGNK